MKRSRQKAYDDVKKDELPQPKQPEVVQPEPISGDLPPLPPKEFAVKPESMVDKVVTKEVTEEIVQLSDPEKKEFMNMLVGKHREIYKDMQTILMKIDDVKLQEKQKFDEELRNKLQEIDGKYDAEKKKVEARYAPALERYQKLADKFKIDIGIEDEDTIQQPPPIEPVETPTPPGPAIDETYLGKEDTFDPEISKLLRELDEKVEPKKDS